MKGGKNGKCNAETETAAQWAAVLFGKVGAA